LSFATAPSSPSWAPATTPLVTINQIHPILVRFAVPAASLQRIRQYASTTLPVSAHPASAPYPAIAPETTPPCLVTAPSTDSTRRSFCVMSLR